MYDNGFGVEQNYIAAISWYERAAAQGDVEAIYNLGKFYAKGLGVDKDAKRALAYWEAAAKQGHMKARRRAEQIAKTIKPEG